MRKIPLFIAVAVIIINMIACATYAQDLELVNNSNLDALPPGGALKSYIFLDTTMNHSGNEGSSIKVVPTGTSSVQGWAPHLRFTLSEPLTQGKKYCLSIWYKHQSPDDNPKPFDGSFTVRYIQNTLAYNPILSESTSSRNVFIPNLSYSENGENIGTKSSYRLSAKMGSETDVWQKAVMSFVATQDMAENLSLMYFSVYSPDNEQFKGTYSIWLDDISLREMPDTETVLTGTAPAAGGTLNPTAGAEIVFTYTYALDPYLLEDNLKVYINDEKRSVSAKVVESRNLVLNINLRAGMDYKISVTGLKDWYGRNAQNAELSFKVSEKVNMEVKVFDTLGNEINTSEIRSGHIKLDVKNNTGIAIDCVVAVLVYQNNHIKKAYFSNLMDDILPGESRSSNEIAFSGIGSGDKVKAYAWSELTNDLRPLRSVIEIK